MFTRMERRGSGEQLGFDGFSCLRRPLSGLQAYLCRESCEMFAVGIKIDESEVSAHPVVVLGEPR